MTTRLYGQLALFGLIGLGTNALWYVIYLGLVMAGMPVLVAMTAVYVSGVLASFVLNRRYTFRSALRRDASFMRFAASYAVGYVFNLTGLSFGVDVMHWPHQYVQLFMIFACAAMLFVLQRHWVFRDVSSP